MLEALSGTSLKLLLPPALQPMPEMLDLTALKLYKLHAHSVARVTDLPIEVPATVKRYKLHKRSSDAVD